MSKTTALERSQAKIAKLAELQPDQRVELLKLAGVGTAGQARAIGRAFKVLEQALDATDEVKVGKGGNGRLVSRPNWDARLKAARSLFELLGAAVVRKTVAAGPTRTVVNVIAPGYATGQAATVEAAATVVEMQAVDAPDDDSYSAAYAARLASRLPAVGVPK